jgi:hypothetical protein
MYPAYEQAKERQQAMLDLAAGQRHGQRMRKLGRATRRAERAARQLHRCRSEAIRLTAELAELELEPRL